jgi:immunoglobulin-binding protein 1
VDAGDEDNKELVDQATMADREWDDWKESNPKGWGNKMGKRY